MNCWENPLNIRRKTPRTQPWTLFTTLVNAHIQTAALRYYVVVVIPENTQSFNRGPGVRDTLSCTPHSLATGASS